MPLYRPSIIVPPYLPQPLHRPAPGLLSNGIYYTNFPNTENPMSEGGLWLQGLTNGIDWQNIRTTPGKAFGTQSGTSGVFDDSIALLRGSWDTEQEVRATVFNTVGAGADYFAETELHVRGTITPHGIFTYEITFGMNPNNTTQRKHYVELVKWQGSRGTFFSLTGGNIDITAPQAGDVVSAKISGSTITAFVNGVQVAQATDSVGLSGTAPYTSGNPGFGHWLHNQTASGDPTTYGFSDFLAQPMLSIGDPENYGRPEGHTGQGQLHQLLAV